MSHFAKIDENGIVLAVNVVDNENLLNSEGVEEEAVGIEYLNTLTDTECTWVQTSYNNSFRKQYAGIGWTYDKTNDVFISPQPFPSWTLDANFDWQAPKPLPAGDKQYSWNEDEGQVWDEIEE
tara:strand:- start:99 stop:467 length:369 start_codon:yes stop_codon:yes gene_type:complete